MPNPTVHEYLDDMHTAVPWTEEEVILVIAIEKTAANTWLCYGDTTT